MNSPVLPEASPTGLCKEGVTEVSVLVLVSGRTQQPQF